MKTLLISFSDNSDHQDVLYSMYQQFEQDPDVYAMGIVNPKYPIEATPQVRFVKAPPKPGVCKQTFNLKELFSILRFVRGKKIERLYFESLHVWNLPLILLKPKGCKAYQVIHDAIPHVGDKQEKMVDIMNRLVAKMADCIILRNEKYADFFCDRYSLPPSRLKVLRLWRSWPEYSPLRHTGRVLFFGRINAYKGAENLLQIVKQCPEIPFDVVGRVDDGMQGVVDQLSACPNVTINANYVTNAQMDEYFRNADWLILPYKSATQSGVVIDAYKFSRPVIAFGVGDIPNQIEDGQTGFLIEPGDIEKFVQTLKENIGNAAQYANSAYQYGFSMYGTVNAKERFIQAVMR